MAYMNWLWYCMLGAFVQLEPELLRSRYSASVDHRPLDNQRVRWLVGVCFLAIITTVQSCKEGGGHHRNWSELQEVTLAHLYRELSHIGLQELEEMVYW